jgi:circadian clock protein KaiC
VPAAPLVLHSKSTPMTSTGIPGLDEILGGGLPTDRMYLVQGDPGVGKTTLALQFLLEGARNGEPVLYIALSETRAEIEAVAGSHGWSLDKVTIHEAIGAGTFAESDNTLFHPDEVELHETTRQVLAEVERVRPTRIVIDSLSEVRLLTQSMLRYRRQVLALKQYFAGRKCTVILLDDRTAEPGGEIHLQSIVHGVIGLEQRAPGYGSDRRRLRVQKLRGVRFVGGYHDFVIETGGVRVFPRLVAADHGGATVAATVRSGIPQLDQLLGGGLEAGTATLLIGPAGSGKSSLATKFVLEAAARGERSAMFLFDERRSTVFARSRSLGMDLQRAVESGEVLLRQVEPAELAPGEFVAAVRDAVERHGARTLVIDSVNSYLQAMPEERFLTVQMHELLTYLARQNVTTILVVAQHGFVGTHMQTPIDMSYLADTVVLLRFFEAEGEIRKAVSVLKKRSGGHETTIREYLLSSRGPHVGPVLRDFQGVLTGVPSFRGDAAQLSARER